MAIHTRAAKASKEKAQPTRKAQPEPEENIKTTEKRVL